MLLVFFHELIELFLTWDDAVLGASLLQLLLFDYLFDALRLPTLLDLEATE